MSFPGMRTFTKRWLIVATAVSAWLAACSTRTSTEGALSPTQAAAWIKEERQLQLIDVRSEPEYASGRLAGGKLIPVQEIEDRLSEIDPKLPVLLYCRSGSRSATALKVLHAHGYGEAKHLQGGIIAWRAARLPITK
jgi:rhodanese-related sulfurtransferase